MYILPGQFICTPSSASFSLILVSYHCAQSPSYIVCEMESLWPYHFVSLSEDEKFHRRERLNARGVYAQSSLVIVLCAVRIYQICATVLFRANGAPSRHGPVSWWDRPPVAGWLETRRQYLVCGLWLGWLLTLAVWRSGDGMFRVLLGSGFRPSASIMRPTDFS